MMQQHDYNAALYAPPSAHAWSDAVAQHTSRPLAWRAAPLPAAAHHSQQQQQQQQPSSRLHAEQEPAGSLAARQLGWRRESISNTPAAPVLGHNRHGYTLVVTNTPISPSGYSVPAAQHPQHCCRPMQQTANWPRAVQDGHTTSVAVLHSCCQPSCTAAASTGSSSGSSSNSSRGASIMSAAAPPAAALASAAAAALAALAGGGSRISSAPLQGGYAARSSNSAAATPPGAAAAAPSMPGGRSSMLVWNVREREPSPQCQQQQSPVARRGAQPGPGSGYTPSSQQQQLSSSSGSSSRASSSGGSRPSSQGPEAASLGLLKLKQLSTARFARRVVTPPPPTAGRLGGFAASGSWGRAADAGSGSPSAASAAAGTVPPAASNTSRATHQAGGSSRGTAALAAQGGGAHAYAAASPPPVATSSGLRRNSSGNGSSGGAAGSTDSGRNASSSSTAARVPAPAPIAAASRSSRGFSSFVQGLFGSNTSSSEQGLSAAARATTAALAAAGPEAEFVQVARQPCPSCGRCFAPAALQQHAAICDKVFGHERKAFNSKARRLQGTGALQHQQDTSSNGGRKQQQRGQNLDSRPAASSAQRNKAAKWKAQSEQLRAAMRGSQPQAAAGSSWGVYGAYEAATAAPEDDRVPCPHCGRRFAALVAERHVPKCAEAQARPNRLAAGGGKGAYMRSGSRK